jgi:TonB family protein
MRGPYRIPARLGRLSAFLAASAALHVAMLVTVPPSGVAGAPLEGVAVRPALHAVLSPAPVAASSAQPQPAEDQSTPASPNPRPVDVEAKAQTRAGVPGGPELPLPDKWYTAAELDVRAEPLGEVILDYPEALEGTGIPGRVRLMLYIDERGIVRRMEITESEPARLFDKAAMRAWAQVRFSPAKKGGVPVKSQKLLELDFRP